MPITPNDSDSPMRVAATIVEFVNNDLEPRIASLKIAIDALTISVNSIRERIGDNNDPETWGSTQTILQLDR